MNFDNLIKSARSHAGSQVAITVSVPLDTSKLGIADDPPAVDGLEFPGFDRYRFALDYSVCWWYGSLIRFDKHQAGAIRVLKQSYDNCVDEIEVERLAIAAKKPGQSLEKIFRGCSEWKLVVEETNRDGVPCARFRSRRI